MEKVDVKKMKDDSDFDVEEVKEVEVEDVSLEISDLILTPKKPSITITELDNKNNKDELLRKLDEFLSGGR